MKRREFIRNGSSAGISLCLGAIGMQSCIASKMIPVEVVNNEIKLDQNVFYEENGKELRSIILQPRSLDYPIVVFKNGTEKFESILLECTHQGTELNVYGDLISCPAHGSEFSKEGLVSNGPATDNLKRFSTKLVNQSITISLR